MAITTVVMVLLFGALEVVSSAWIDGERRIDTHQRARGALELVARELTPAVVDTRMQFVMLPSYLLADVGATHVVPNSPAMLWMAPIGTNGELRCVGYYLYRDTERKFYRLKRIFIKPDNDLYFPKLTNYDNARAADGIIAFWVQAYDLLGNPIPWVSESVNHPSSDLIYNSAAYFQMATTTPFDNGESFAYLSESPMVMKGNKVPAEIEISVVTIDRTTMARDPEIPEMQLILRADGSLDVDESVDLFLEELKANGINRSKVFSTRVKLVNGAG